MATAAPYSTPCAGPSPRARPPSRCSGPKVRRKNPMAKLIELQADGVTVTARLLEDKAPNTIRRFWEALPIEQTLRHVRWGGNAAYILVPELKDPSFGVENQVSFYFPRTIGYKPEHGEFAFSYGQAQARSLAGN